MDKGGRDGDGGQFDRDTVQLRQTYDWSATLPSLAAVTALATVRGVDPIELPTELDTTLHDFVDSEALDALVRDQKSEQVTISFTIDRHRIWFEGDELRVHARDR